MIQLLVYEKPPPFKGAYLNNRHHPCLGIGEIPLAKNIDQLRS